MDFDPKMEFFNVVIFGTKIQLIKSFNFESVFCGRKIGVYFSV